MMESKEPMMDEMDTMPPYIPVAETESAPGVSGNVLLEKARRFGVLSQAKKNLKSELDAVTSEMTSIQEEIAEKMLAENPRLRVKVAELEDGTAVFKTVHVYSEIWAGHNGDEAGLMEAMKNCGLADMVKEKFNTSTLSSWVREKDPDKKMTAEELKESLPPEIQEFIKISKVLKMGCKG